MTKNLRSSAPELAVEQAAKALLTATFAFLLRNNISKGFIVDAARRARGGGASNGEVRQYLKMIRAYEDLGMIMSTWFSHPKFLDRDGSPIPLTMKGPRSISQLVRASRVKTSAKAAVELMRQSPSVGVDAVGNFIALKRVFVLPNFEVPRAALVIDRYLDTLRRNSSAQKEGTTLLLERNCHVPEVDLKRITPILRDIKGRGTAFMDSVDGDIEARRIGKSQKRGVGELGVLVFAWTRPSNSQRRLSKPESNSRIRTRRGGIASSGF
jgi:hypothetical protein